MSTQYKGALGVYLGALAFLKMWAHSEANGLSFCVFPVALIFDQVAISTQQVAGGYAYELDNQWSPP
jgi:hypothetical protein